MQHHIDYASPTSPACRQASLKPLIVLPCIVLAINVALLALASVGGRGGILVAMILGPATNMLTAGVALTLTKTVRHTYGSKMQTPYVACAVAFPIAAIFGDFLVIVAMGWTGC
jgi:hypothetical protein